MVSFPVLTNGINYRIWNHTDKDNAAEYQWKKFNLFFSRHNVGFVDCLDKKQTLTFISLKISLKVNCISRHEM